MVDARQTRALLELIAHLGQTDDQQRRSPRVLSPAEDVPLDLVREHGLGPLAFRAGYDQLRDDWARSAMRGPMCADAVDRAVAALTAIGVPVILRGAASYVGVLYDEPGERPIEAVELLVARADLARARRAVGDLTVDIDIAVDHELAPAVRDRIPIGPLWERALPAIERDDDALRLDPVDDAVVHMAAIAAGQLLAPAIDYVDAIRLLRRRGCDRQRTMERAAELGMARAIGAVITMTDALAAGAVELRWASRRQRVLPTPAEVVMATPAPRARQLLRQAALAETARDLAGLLASRVRRRG